MTSKRFIVSFTFQQNPNVGTIRIAWTSHCRRATAGLLGTPCGVDREHPIVGAPTLIGAKWNSFVTTNFGVNVDIALSIASSRRFLQQSPAEVLMVCVVCRCDIVSRHPKALHAAVPSEAVPLPTGADHRLTDVEHRPSPQGSAHGGTF